LRQKRITLLFKRISIRYKSSANYYNYILIGVITLIKKVIIILLLLVFSSTVLISYGGEIKKESTIFDKSKKQVSGTYFKNGERLSIKELHNYVAKLEKFHIRELDGRLYLKGILKYDGNEYDINTFGELMPSVSKQDTAIVALLEPTEQFEISMFKIEKNNSSSSLFPEIRELLKGKTAIEIVFLNKNSNDVIYIQDSISDDNFSFFSGISKKNYKEKTNKMSELQLSDLNEKVKGKSSPTSLIRRLYYPNESKLKRDAVEIISNNLDRVKTSVADMPVGEIVDDKTNLSYSYSDPSREWGTASPIQEIPLYIFTGSASWWNAVHGIDDFWNRWFYIYNRYQGFLLEETYTDVQFNRLYLKFERNNEGEIPKLEFVLYVSTMNAGKVIYNSVYNKYMYDSIDLEIAAKHMEVVHANVAIDNNIVVYKKGSTQSVKLPSWPGGQALKSAALLYPPAATVYFAFDELWQNAYEHELTDLDYGRGYYGSYELQDKYYHGEIIKSGIYKFDGYKLKDCPNQHRFELHYAVSNGTLHHNWNYRFWYSY